MWEWVDESQKKLVRIIRIIEEWRKEKYTKMSDGRTVILRKVS